MSSGEVVGCIFFTWDELLGMEELTIGACSDLVDDGGFEVEEDWTWDVFSRTGLTEECVEGVITAADCFVGWHLTVWLDAVL